jgi:hypothetical protein
MNSAVLPDNDPEAALGQARHASRLAGEHPGVSCICLTYARPEVLEEAIHSFLQQDYAGPKELIVLNDYDAQLLELDHPEVLVVNLPRRLRTVGEKMNLAVSLAAHDLLFVWDDDDIYLPHRLTFSVAKLDVQRGFFKPDKAWHWNSGTLSGPAKNVFHSGSCWARRLFDEVGGYPAEGSGYDQVFEQRLERRFPSVTTAYDIRPEDIYYIYRWGGTNSYHMSGFGDYQPGANVGHEHVAAYVQGRAEQAGIRRGRIVLRPHWRDDYQRLVTDFLRSPAASRAEPPGEPHAAPRPAGELAYLIVAHHQPKHLARLVRALDQEHSHFFIHVDKRAAMAPFKAAVPRQANVVLLPDRVPVRWGRLSVVRAVLKLLRAAAGSGHAFKYYTLLSGSDYPIKSRQEIHARLLASDCQFIRVDRRLVGEPNAHFEFIKRLPPGTYFGDLVPYHGSMYWSLTADCVNFILAFLKENPGFVDLHRQVHAPDEIFFHSLVKASPFAEAIVHDFERGTCADDLLHANHYIDWGGRRPRENLTLDERDFADLLASAALFARKFHQEKSRQLLDLIDDRVHASKR